MFSFVRAWKFLCTELGLFGYVDVNTYYELLLIILLLPVYFTPYFYTFAVCGLYFFFNLSYYGLTIVIPPLPFNQPKPPLMETSRYMKFRSWLWWRRGCETGPDE